MRPRTLNLWILWLLPLLIARLCVPMGFMVSGTANGLEVMLCPVYAALPQSSGAHEHHAGMDHSAHAMHQGGAEQGPAHEGLSQSLCPFAASGTATFAATVPTIDHFYLLVGTAPVLDGEPTWISPAVLIDRIRGPPVA